MIQIKWFASKLKQPIQIVSEIWARKFLLPLSKLNTQQQQQQQQ